jgi:hypothetical protein
LTALREALATSTPGVSPPEIDTLVEAIRRQHEDPEEHDRSLIAERLTRSPLERLRALQAFLGFAERARASRES